MKLSERIRMFGKAVPPDKVGITGEEAIQIANEVAQLEAEAKRLREKMSDVCDILADYDGYRTPEGLMGLIDEVRKILADALLEAKEQE